MNEERPIKEYPKVSREEIKKNLDRLRKNMKRTYCPICDEYFGCQAHGRGVDDLQ
jgi:RNase P subunit RPR2